jgi:hypothetical protein
MTTRPRHLILALSIVALAIAACGGPGTIEATPAPPAPATAGTSDAPASPGESTAAGGGQSDTTWGRIWDGVPAGFPRFAGARDADDATPEPVSDVYAVEGGDATEISAWLQAAMETATYSTEGLSGPLEDGTFVLDSVGDGGCRIQTTIAPTGSLVLVTVLYGADCPAS